MECPTCGQAISHKDIDDKMSEVLAEFASRGVKLRKSEARVLLALKGKNRPVPLWSILDALYIAKPEGPPDWADNVVTIHVSRLRSKIAAAGLPWKIVNFPGFGYELDERQTSKTLKTTACWLGAALLVAHPLAKLF